LLQAVSEGEFDLALVDMNYSRDTTSGEEGLNLLTRLKEFDQAPPVVVLTAWGSVELAVEAMKKGAKDFVLKPWDNARLLATIRIQLELRDALEPQATTIAEILSFQTHCGLLGLLDFHSIWLGKHGRLE